MGPVMQYQGAHKSCQEPGKRSFWGGSLEELARNFRSSEEFPKISAPVPKRPLTAGQILAEESSVEVLRQYLETGPASKQVAAACRLRELGHKDPFLFDLLLDTIEDSYSWSHKWTSEEEDTLEDAVLELASYPENIDEILPVLKEAIENNYAHWFRDAALECAGNLGSLATPLSAVIHEAVHLPSDWSDLRELTSIRQAVVAAVKINPTDPALLSKISNLTRNLPEGINDASKNAAKLLMCTFYAALLTGISIDPKLKTATNFFSHRWVGCVEGASWEQYTKPMELAFVPLKKVAAKVPDVLCHQIWSRIKDNDFESRYLRLYLVKLACSWPEKADIAGPAILEEINRDDDFHHSELFSDMYRLLSYGKLLLPYLISVLAKNEPANRKMVIAAIKFLGRMGPDAKEATNELAMLLFNDQEDVRNQAREALDLILGKIVEKPSISDGNTRPRTAGESGSGLQTLCLERFSLPAA